MGVFRVIFQEYFDISISNTSLSRLVAVGTKNVILRIIVVKRNDLL